MDLGVLVVTDGNAWTEAIRQQLSSEGVPTNVVNLSDPGRPTITSSYLSGTLANGTPEGHFQGVVLPNDAAAGLSADEMTALANYETAFSVRQVDAYPTRRQRGNEPARLRRVAGRLGGDRDDGGQGGRIRLPQGHL